MTHTATPWRISERVAKLGPDSFITIVSPDRWIAHVLEGCVNSETDAAFIVKAVNAHAELVEALKPFAEVGNEWGRTHGDAYKFTLGDLRRAQAVIKKVTL